jgi:hypothetical protein
LKNKKGQITIYIFLGLFVLLLFGVIIYLNSSVEEPDIVQGLDGVSVNRYVEQCMQTKVERTIDTLFKQGGWLYKEDGGSLDTSDFEPRKVVMDSVSYPGDVYRIPYGLVEQTLPQYVVPKDFKRPLRQDNIFGEPVGLFDHDTNTPYFGRNVMPKLCNRDGPNGLAASAAFTCIPELYNFGKADKYLTIQSQLNAALDGAIFSCLEDAQTQFTFEFRGSGAVNVTFGDSDVLVPVDIILESSDFQQPLSFSYPLRVKQLYSLAYLLVDAESKSITFDLETDAPLVKGCTFEGTTCYDASMQISLAKDYLSVTSDVISTSGNHNDDLLVITDRASKISHESSKNALFEEPYLTIPLMIDNRRPYLERMPDLPESNAIIGDDFSDLARSEVQRTFTYEMHFYDPDGDHIQMYDDPLKYLIFRSTAPEYYNPLVGIRLPYGSGEFSDLPLTRKVGGLGLEGSGILSCLGFRHCKHEGLDFSDPDNFYTTYYFFKATINDGEFSDFQTFELVVAPR